MGLVAGLSTGCTCERHVSVHAYCVKLGHTLIILLFELSVCMRGKNKGILWCLVDWSGFQVCHLAAMTGSRFFT